MPTWSFADPATGEFTGGRFAGPDDLLEVNTPAGLLAVLGEHDPLAARVEVSTGEVVPFVSPHAGRLAREAEEDAVQQRLAEIDLRALRSLRELAINPNDHQARERLLEHERQAERLRPRARGNNGTP